MTRKLPELLTGLVVLVIAALFLIYALGRADTGVGGGYLLTARFASIGALTAGSDVKIGGVVVGHVADEHLDPQTFAAVIRLRIDNDIKLPVDTSAAISSDGLLGGNYVALSPGGSTDNLAPGQSFQVTQSAINIEDLLGKFIFNMGGSGGKPAAAGSPGPAPSATPGAPAGTPGASTAP